MPKLDPIDPEKVQSLAAAGATDTDIAEYFRRSVATIQRRFPKQLLAGRELVPHFDSPVQKNSLWSRAMLPC